MFHNRTIKISTFLLAGLVLVLVLASCVPPPSSYYGPYYGPYGEPPPGPGEVNPDPGSTMLWPDGGTLVYVPGGEFIIGGVGDQPEHTELLESFWIYKTKVTNRQYKMCVDAGYCPPTTAGTGAPDPLDPAYANYPVVNVNWEMASMYCGWAGSQLPFSLHWEGAARGPMGYMYPWGNSAPNCSLLNFNNCVGGTTDVYTYPAGASFYGLLDMAGNAWEWVQDSAGPDSGARIVRSSSFSAGPGMIPVALSHPLPPGEFSNDLGFRCSVVKPLPYPPFCRTIPYESSIAGYEGEGGDCQAPDFTINGYGRDGDFVFINLDFAVDSIDPNAVTVTGNGEPLACSSVPDYPNRLYCRSSRIGLDQWVEIVVCLSDCGQPPQEETFQGDNCPPGYSYNPETQQCQYGVFLDNVQNFQGGNCPPGYSFNEETQQCQYGLFVDDFEDNCPLGYAYYEGWGCLPYPDEYGQCPFGYFLDTSSERCFPANSQDDCPITTEMPYNTNLCYQQCLPGYVYNPDMGCCEPANQVNYPGCPVGYIYSAEINYCVPSIQWEGGCVRRLYYLQKYTPPKPTKTRKPQQSICYGLDYDQCNYQYNDICYWPEVGGCQPR